MRKILCLLVAISIAGCFNPPDEEDDRSETPDSTDTATDSQTQTGASTGTTTATTTTTTTTTTTGPGNNTGYPPGNGTGNETGNGTGNQTQYVWRYDNRTGELSGTELIFLGGDEAEESFTIPNGTLNLWVNLTLDGDDATWAVRAPGCTSDDCETPLETDGGMGAFNQSGPAEGEWTFVLRSDSGVGPFETSYSLAAASKEPAEA